MIEVKQTGIEDLVARAVRDADALARCSLCAFDAGVCAASAEAMPEVPVSLLAAPNREAAGVLAQAADLGLAGVSLHYSMVDEQLVRDAHDVGLSVATWTVNDEAEARSPARGGRGPALRGLPREPRRGGERRVTPRDPGGGYSSVSGVFSRFAHSPIEPS